MNETNQRELSVAVLGAGPIGCATAVYLQDAGHQPSIWSPTAWKVRLIEGRARFKTVGAFERDVDIPMLSSSDELAGFDVVVICLPAHAYQAVLAPLAGIWRSGQTLVVSGSLSLCPLWLHDEAAKRGQSIRSIGWGTTATTAYFASRDTLRLNRLRDRIDMAAIGDAPDGALEVCNAMLGHRFELSDNLLTPTLANINPIAHAAQVLLNLTRMDKGEDWLLFENVTPAVARMEEGLDRERLEIARAYGLSIPSLAEHYSRSYHVKLASLEDIAAEISSRSMGVHGPKTLEHRYVIEDAPFGLAFIEHLARIAQVPTPCISASITLLSQIYGRDFRAGNFLIDELFDRAEEGAASAEDKVESLRMRCAAARSEATAPL